MVLYRIVSKALVALASGRTRRYFLSKSEDEIQKLVNTVIALRSLKKHETIEAAGDEYEKEDYMLPSNLVDYVNTRRIYFNNAAVGCGEFILPSGETVPLLGNDEDGSTSDLGEDSSSTVSGLLSPTQVESFFRKFNENQKEGETINLTPVTEATLSLSDFKELVAKIGKDEYVSVDWNPSGTKPVELAILADIESLVDAKYLSQHRLINEEEVEAWIFKSSNSNKSVD